VASTVLRIDSVSGDHILFNDDGAGAKTAAGFGPRNHLFVVVDGESRKPKVTVWHFDYSSEPATPDF
jgi:hypothetical protein